MMIHSLIRSFICSERQVQFFYCCYIGELQINTIQCVKQCEPDSKAQKRTLTAAL